jgi:hypothetical protein
MLIVAAMIALAYFAYTFGFEGAIHTSGSAPVSRLEFPEGTFRFASPFFSESGTDLFIGTAPPAAGGGAAWRLRKSGGHFNIEPAFVPPGATNALNHALQPAGSALQCGSGQPEGLPVSAGDSASVGMTFSGLRFRKPVLILFSQSGTASNGIRFDAFSFGKRSVSVCTSGRQIAAFSWALWNVDSAVALNDTAHLDIGRKLLFATNDAASASVIYALEYP